MRSFRYSGIAHSALANWKWQRTSASARKKNGSGPAQSAPPKKYRCQPLVLTAWNSQNSGSFVVVCLIVFTLYIYRPLDICFAYKFTFFGCLQLFSLGVGRHLCRFHLWIFIIKHTCSYMSLNTALRDPIDAYSKLARCMFGHILQNPSTA